MFSAHVRYLHSAKRTVLYKLRQILCIDVNRVQNHNSNNISYSCINIYSTAMFR